MAEDLTPETRALPAASVVAPAIPASAPEIPASPLREKHPVFRWRFAIAYLTLAVVAGTGVGLAIVLFQQPEEPAPPTWSSWEPTGRETSYPDQIADYVGASYRHESGNPLAVVIPSPPEVQDVPLEFVVIQDRSPVPAVEPSNEVVPTSDSLIYRLCGLGDQCSIAEGTPSPERLQILRREALELALYTFRYVEGAGSTIVMLPPNLGEDPESAEDDQAVALFFRKKDFQDVLSRPLRRTLAAPAPPPGAELQGSDADVVDRLTIPHLFGYQFQQVQTGAWIMILSPLAPRR